MENLLVLVPLVITVGHCIISGCIYRKMNNRITFLEEKVNTLFYPPAPPPVYQVPSQVMPMPQGYGYVYSGGQGNLNVI